jgi:hypothetical protein
MPVAPRIGNGVRLGVVGVCRVNMLDDLRRLGKAPLGEAGHQGPLPPRCPGNPAKRFQPGISGNPSGKPKSFSIHQLMAEAIDDKETRTEAVRRVQENLKNRRSVLATLELAARLNTGKIGLGSEDRPPSTFVSNLQPGALKRRPESERTSRIRRERSRKDGAA